MMSWVKSQQSTNANIERKKVEPGATYSLFENHWAQAAHVMQTSEDPEGALIVISHLSQMISFLGMTRGEAVSSEKSCKGFWLQHRCSDEVIRWLSSLQVRGMELPYPDELKLVAMLHSLCEAASRDGELLGYVKAGTKDANKDSWDGAYALASLLLEYSLRNAAEIAETARYSFIQLIQLAGKFPVLERSLSQESGLALTNVVVSGLSACFAQLPTFTEASWSQLSPFIEQLKFVDDVAQAAPDTVAATIAECFTTAFLLAVIEPALIQDVDEGSFYKPNEHDLSYVTSLNEEIGIVTYYVEVVCRNITHPYLVKSLMYFVNKKLLNTLIHRLNTNESVSVVVSTLSLFNVLLNFYCEDFWAELILKYLIPQQHLMVSERHLQLQDIDFYESSTGFLNLLPLVISEAFGPEMIESYFLQYVNEASARWSSFDTMIRTKLGIGRATVIETLDDKSSENEYFQLNTVFPLWRHSYDGTDRGVEALPKWGSIDCAHRQSTTISDSSTGGVPSDFTLTSLPLSDSSNFTTINLQHGSGSVEILESTVSRLSNGTQMIPRLEKLTLPTNQSDGYASMESEESPFPLVGQDNEAVSTVASFGPFLDSILVQLSNWPHLDLNVILMLTEVVSIMASCRIPLVNSLLLDPTLTLQPYYLTFNTLLKRIREDLEYQLKDITGEAILSVWETMDFSEDDHYGRSTMFGAGPLSLSPSSFSNQLGDTIRRTIAGGGAEAFANVWKRFNRKSSSPVSKVHPSSGTIMKSPELAQSPRNETKLQIPDTSKVMVKRLIFFSHWLLELSAIAQQFCWKAAYN